MSVTITRLFDDYAGASQAVRDLEAAGLSASDISIVANNSDNMYTEKTVKKADSGEGAEVGAGIGAVAGGTAGLLAGLGILAIPGIGPVVAAGWLVSLLAGAATVGVTGGIIGALMQSGVSEEEAHVYAEGVRRGGTIVTARVPDSEVVRYEAILDRSAVDIEARQETFRQSGWTGSDKSAPRY